MGSWTLGVSTGSSERHFSASLLEMPRPACCQNCFAIENAPLGKNTIWRSAHDEAMDESLLVTTPLFCLSSGQMMRCTRRAVTGVPRVADLCWMKVRHWSAIVSVEKSMHFSSPRVYFCSQNSASCCIVNDMFKI